MENEGLSTGKIGFSVDSKGRKRWTDLPTRLPLIVNIF